MLKDENGKRPLQIEIPQEKWIETKHTIRKGIMKKLDVAKKLIETKTDKDETDKEVSAGLYIYAVEEFGKLLLLDNSKLQDGKGKINYNGEFVNHEIKFGKAFDHLQGHNYNNCIVLNDEGSFSAESFTWRSFTIGLIPETAARLSIFYVDFVYTDEDAKNINIMKNPLINVEILINAINELKTALNELPI